MRFLCQSIAAVFMFFALILCCFFSKVDQLSHLYRSASKVTVLYILILTFMWSENECRSSICRSFRNILRPRRTLSRNTNCDLYTHNQSRSYLNHLVFIAHWYKKFELSSSKYFAKLITLQLRDVNIAYIDRLWWGWWW